MKIVETNWIDRPENIGCNNGQLGVMEVVFDDHGPLIIMPCRCGNGCNGADRIPHIGESFEDEGAFWASVDSTYWET